jgi:hypothetical protein
MLQIGSTIPVSVTPLLEQGLPLFKELVWPVFWLIVIFYFKSGIRGLLSALIDLLNRVVKVKGWGVEIGVLPPENTATFTQGVKEKYIEIERTTAPEGVNILPPEGAKITRKTVRMIDRGTSQK